jgi:hypothetical protein
MTKAKFRNVYTKIKSILGLLLESKTYDKILDV